MPIATTHMIIFSPCGGSAKVAEALLRKIPGRVVTHEWTLPADRDNTLSFDSSDLVFLVFPVYGGKMPVNSARFFTNLKGHETPCALVSVYGNRAFEGSLLEMEDLARERDFKPVAAVAAIARHSMAPNLAKGRPDDTDIDKLSAYGLEIHGLAEKGHRLNKAPGKPREWTIPSDMDFYPKTDPEKCTRCGTCVKVCPTAAIPGDDPTVTDIALCIDCYACVKYCPTHARTLGDAKAIKFFEPHLREAAIRKEAQLFI